MPHRGRIGRRTRSRRRLGQPVVERHLHGFREMTLATHIAYLLLVHLLLKQIDLMLVRPLDQTD